MEEDNRVVRTLTVLYDTEISVSEILLFRGAVLKSFDNQADILCHNHIDENTYRYSYPLIQYKRLNGKGAITCVGKGVNLIGQILSEFSGTIKLGTREAVCKVDQILSSKTLIQVEDTFFTYQLYRWLPLNARNYGRYQQTEELVEKIKILEQVLTGNILSFLKGINIHLWEQVVVRITDISSQKVITYKDVKLMAFDIEFKANINLPPYIGVGKNASVGFGVLSVTNK